MILKEKETPPPQQIETHPSIEAAPRAKGDFYSLNPSDLQKINDYVQAYPGMEDKRITASLDKLEKNMPEHSEQNCSQGVRKAIMAERGIDIFKGANEKEVNTVNGREAATGYGIDRMLLRNGYERISSGADYIPKRGDVQSICFGKVVKGYGGHVQYYDGDSWISDHKQRESAVNPEALRAQDIDPEKVIVMTYRRK
ncbi:MAG: hypothetical protein ACOY3I_05115 [Verrucomicrobiota bacterium]